jgi:hypothetical protein
MKINLEDMVMGDIIRWRTQKDITFINVKDLVEAYWKDYFNVDTDMVSNGEQR